MPDHGVYSYGVISSTTQYVVAGGFPLAEGYGEIVEIHYMTGGEAANSSVVLSRLGARVLLDGNWLGDDDAGLRTRQFLSDNGIATPHLSLRKNYSGVQEVVFSAEGKRTIFGTYGALLENREWNAPNESDIVSAKVVCLDPFFREPAARVAKTAQGAAIPVVTVDCRFDDPLLQHVSALVVAESFIREHYPDTSVDTLMAQYLSACSGLVIFTFGDATLFYARAGDKTRTMQPYTVEAVDTTGGGDSFRAGIVYGFLSGWDDEETIRYALAVAAITCTRTRGVLDSPSRQEIAEFIERRP